MRPLHRLAVLVAGAAWLAGAPIALAATPVDPAVQAEVMAIYDKWNKAVAAGNLADGLKLHSAARRAVFANEMKTKAAQQEMVAMMRALAPETVEVQHAELNKDGTKVTVETIIGRTMPKGVTHAGAPPAGSKLRNELTLTFLREAGAWKLDGERRGMDPGKVKPCASTAFEGLDSFVEESNTSMGGMIRSVAFNADHTMVVIRMFDQENCIFMPTRAKLTELGLNTDLLVPRAIIEIQAWPHRADKQRVWAEGLKVELAE